jgi:hypothetical protein
MSNGIAKATREGEVVSSKQEFKVIKPIINKGARLKEGAKVSLTADQAKALIESGHIKQ